MKIYFAGVPGGNQKEREANLEYDGILYRLITFFYKDKALVTLNYYKRPDESILQDPNR